MLSLSVVYDVSHALLQYSGIESPEASSSSSSAASSAVPAPQSTSSQAVNAALLNSTPPDPTQVVGAGGNKSITGIVLDTSNTIAQAKAACRVAEGELERQRDAPAARRIAPGISNACDDGGNAAPPSTPRKNKRYLCNDVH